MELNTPYTPSAFLGQQQSATGTFIRAAIESEVMTHIFRTEKQVNQTTIGPPHVPAPTPAFQEIGKVIANPTIMGLIIMFAIFATAVYFITREKKT